MSRGEFGPAEVLAVAFPTDRVPPPVRDGLVKVLESGAVTLLDLVIVRKSATGEVTVVEPTDKPIDIDDDGVPDVDIARPGLAGQEDIDDVAAGLAPGTTALLLVIEHTWSRGLVDAALDAGGTLIEAERIPAVVVNELAALADATVNE